MKRILALLLTVLLLSGCVPKKQSEIGYTYRISTGQLPSQWSAHSLSTGETARLQSLLYAPLCELTVQNSENGIYQWIFVAAEEIRDVTAEQTEVLRKYGSILPSGEMPQQGYVYEIKLRREMKWEDGGAINADTYLYSMKALLDPAAQNTMAASFFSGKAALAGAKTYGTKGGSFEKTVGFYKVDDYTLHYVCQTGCTPYELYSLFSRSFLVHPLKHEASGSAYATTKETTVSCGPYRIESIDAGKEMVLVQNRQYWEYDVTEDGDVWSVSHFEIDGQKRPQFQTQRIVMTVMTAEEAALAYEKGQLDLWTPEEQDLLTNNGTDRMYAREQTFTVRLFFHTDVKTLKELDRREENSNCVVLSNLNFRKAISLALDRQKLTEATAGYVPTLSLVSHLCYYDVQNDPASLYYNTDAFMETLFRRYGQTWDADLPLEEKKYLLAEITGYEPEQAKEQMKAAYSELTEAGLYTPGEEIKIQVAWKSGKLNSSDRQQVAVLNEYINAAAEDSGFGTITLIPVEDLEDRYQDVADGVYAMGLGAWGGSVFQPFGLLRLYCDAEYADPLHEAGCWDPATEQLTLTVDGQEYTMTWKAWSNSMIEGGIFANAPMETKLKLLASLEEQYLEKYYTIPLMNTADCYMLSGKVRNYTQQYNVLYGFGGLRLMQYNQFDQQWEKFLQECGGSPYAATTEE